MAKLFMCISILELSRQFFLVDYKLSNDNDNVLLFFKRSTLAISTVGKNTL